VGDVHTPAQRARNMRAIRARDTTPELRVRRLLHSMGYRFRLHVKGLPGKPDIVLPRLESVILVHGCFWHRHQCRNGQSQPASRAMFWKHKFEQNKKRDRRQIRALRQAGWRVLVVWECQTLSATVLQGRMNRFLNASAGRCPVSKTLPNPGHIQ